MPREQPAQAFSPAALSFQLYHVWSLMHEGVKIWGNELRWLRTVKEPRLHSLVIVYFSSCSTCFPESELFCIFFTLHFFTHSSTLRYFFSTPHSHRPYMVLHRLIQRRGGDPASHLLTAAAGGALLSPWCKYYFYSSGFGTFNVPHINASPHNSGGSAWKPARLTTAHVWTHTHTHRPLLDIVLSAHLTTNTPSFGQLGCQKGAKHAKWALRMRCVCVSAVVENRRCRQKFFFFVPSLRRTARSDAHAALMIL